MPCYLYPSNWKHASALTNIYNIQITYRTPLNVLTLTRELEVHPDHKFVHTLIHNLTYGCNIGYNGPELDRISSNRHSAYHQPIILDTAIANECQVGRILGPFTHPPLPHFRSSGLGLVPKHDSGWRTICHLSAPHNHSINDHIDPSLFSLTYCSIDDAYRIINSIGPGTLMSKIDLKNAFCLIPVCPHDWHLLGM